MVAPFALDGAVDYEKLTELLAVGTELEVLDFKRTLDLGKGDTKDRVEFAKDVAAFSTLPSGGYIVIGVDGKGQVENELPQVNPAQFDEATLRDIANKYMDGRLTIVSSTHLIEGSVVAVVYIGPSPDGFPPMMKRDGWYQQPSGTREVVFRSGDVFIRIGTSCRRIEHRDWPHVLANYRSHIKAEAASDTQLILGRLAEVEREGGAGARRIVIDIAMAPGDFEDAVADAIERRAVEAVRRALRPTRALFATGWQSENDAEEVARALDRVTSIAGVALRQRSMQAFQLAINELYRAYRAALQNPSDTHALYGHERPAATFWRDIAARVLALLAMVVRDEAWGYVRPLVLKPIGGGNYVYRSWLRHAVTEASRATVLVSASTGDPARGAIIRFARAAVAGIPSLRDDIREAELTQDFDADAQPDDRLLNALCQADFLWCVVVIADAGGQDDHHEFYPSCGALYDHRTSPIADLLVRDPAARQAAIDQPDSVVAASLRVVDKAASGEAGWRPWSVMTDTVRAFVDENDP